MTDRKAKAKEILNAFEDALDKINPDMEDAQTAVLLLLSHIQANLGRKGEPNKVHLNSEEFAKYAMAAMTNVLGDKAVAVFSVICWQDGENTSGMMHNPKAAKEQVEEVVYGRIPHAIVQWLAERGVPVGIALVAPLEEPPVPEGVN